MINTLLGADVADVNHPLYPLGKLHERAKLSQAHNRTFDLRTNWKFLCSLSPWIAQRLLQSQRHALFSRIDSKNDRVNRFARFHQIARLADFLYPRHFG